MHSKVWMFSHLIDDEDLAFLQREFISYQQAMEYYGLRYKPVVRMSHVSGSVYKIVLLSFYDNESFLKHRFH